ncbi:MAG: TetR/AcrR family transcriptional regulator [Bacteroidales bacterium]
MNEEFKQIVEKVCALYTRYGIKSITMDDVASNLGISKKTLYKYVTDKDDLVGKVIDIQIEGIHSDLDCKDCKDLNAIEELLIVSKLVNQKLKHINPGTLYDLKKYYAHHYERFANARREKMNTNIINNIKKGKKEGLYREELNESIIAKLQLARIESIVDNAYFSIEEFTSAQFFQEIFVYHIRGMANQKGIDFLETKLKDFNIDDLNTI